MKEAVQELLDRFAGRALKISSRGKVEAVMTSVLRHTAVKFLPSTSKRHVLRALGDKVPQRWRRTWVSKMKRRSK